MMQDEHLPPADPVIEHWDGFKLLGRHWKSRSDECSLCNNNQEEVVRVAEPARAEPELQPEPEHTEHEEP